MNRSTRTFLVVAIAVVLASLSTYLVYLTIKNRPAVEVEVAHNYAVVAAHPLMLGARVTTADVKRVAWPAANPLPNGFAAVEEVLERGVISPIAENEPLTKNNIAVKDAGAGLPPTIPPGMRAISVRVNEVIGVAGFVVPSTHVDVMVVLRQQGLSTVARVVVSNVQVLAAGTKFDQEAAKEGQAIPSSVVTLLVNPEDAERVALAATEGSIMLTLRNPMDTAPTVSPGTRTSSLTTGSSSAVQASAPSPDRPRRAQVAVAPPPPPAPPPPKAYTVEVIRGGKRTEEIIK